MNGNFYSHPSIEILKHNRLPLSFTERYQPENYKGKVIIINDMIFCPDDETEQLVRDTTRRWLNSKIFQKFSQKLSPWAPELGYMAAYIEADDEILKDHLPRENNE